MREPLLRKFLGALLLASIFLAGVAGSDPPKSTFRVHVQTVVQGAPGTQVLAVTLINPTKQIMVRAQPELSERDIMSVESAPADSGVALKLTLSEHGRFVLSTLTTENQGKVLVVFLNGRVVYAPIIDRIIGDGFLIIPRGVAPEEVTPLEEAAKKARK